MADTRKRCAWLGENELMMEYHDEEWGVPLHDDRKHFEFVTLDAFQAGLSWAIILKKREGFRKAFDNFDPTKIARYTKRSVERLVKDAGIVRNRLKIQSTVSNAKAFLEVQEEFGTFDKFIWQFVDGTTKQNKWQTLKQLPAKTEDSDRMSRELKQRGFKFVGSTICYAYMQAAGMVNDHIVQCFRHEEIRKLPK